MNDADAVKESLDIFKQLGSSLNRMGNEENVEDALREYLGKEHRTLQQNFFKHVVLSAIRVFAEKHDNNLFDLRNEASCELAKKLEPFVLNQYLPFI